MSTFRLGHNEKLPKGKQLYAIFQQGRRHTALRHGHTTSSSGCRVGRGWDFYMSYVTQNPI